LLKKAVDNNKFLLFALEKDRRMDRKPISGYLAYFMAVTTLNMGYPTPAN
jgi:hypothetical protein